MVPPVGRDPRPAAAPGTAVPDGETVSDCGVVLVLLRTSSG